jgi:hypothetical protein
MRRLALALALMASPAGAVELLANAPSAAEFLEAAQVTGFAANGQMLTSGPGWFLNYVGVQYAPTGQMVACEGGECPEMAARPGVWARLRLDGPSSNFFNFLTTVQAHGVTAYRQIADPGQAGALCWSSDGVTCYSDQSIGLIGLIM